MSSQVTIGVIALVFVSACGLMSTLTNLRMVEKVNEGLPKEKQIGPLGWNLSNDLTASSRLQRRNPDGHLL
jgi:hypothetical protein